MIQRYTFDDERRDEDPEGDYVLYNEYYSECVFLRVLEFLLPANYISL